MCTYQVKFQAFSILTEVKLQFEYIYLRNIKDCTKQCFVIYSATYENNKSKIFKTKLGYLLPCVTENFQDFMLYSCNDDLASQSTNIFKNRINATLSLYYLLHYSNFFLLV